MTTRKFKIGLDVDSRTDTMSDAALTCRTFGHKWERRALSRSRVLELLKVGCTEYFRYCEHGCGSTWRQVYSFRERTIIENERTYPKNGEYLMRKGSGRLDRNTAREAQFMREYSDILS